METIDLIRSESLKAIAELVSDLAELRLRDCPHLVIENFAPELLGRLLLVYQDPERFLSQIDTEWFQAATGRKSVCSDNN